MSVRIIVDSATDIRLEEEKNLTIIPLTVQFGQKSYLDGVDINHEEFFEKLIEGDELPTTSQANPAQFEKAFRQAVDAGDEVLCITISSKLSGTHQSAYLASREFGDAVQLVDSENASLGARILIDRALELALEGKSAKEIKDILDEEKKRIRVIALLDTLEYLKRGGRISSAAAVVGGLLAIKPVIAVVDGEVAILGKARGSKNGNNFLMKEIHKSNGVDFTKPISLAYSGLDDSLLKKYIKDSREIWDQVPGELDIHTIGSAIGTHAGPGAIAVAFFEK